jgi:hypothetical protein
VYVANHPPLLYAVAAGPLRLGQRLGAPRAGFVAARLVSVSLAAAGVAMAAWLAVLLVPGRPRVAVGAAWLAALLPSLPHVSGFVYNDGLGFLAATAALVAAVAVVRRGPTLPRLAGLTAASAAAALTRAPGLALAAVAGAAAAGGVLLHRGGRPARRVLAAAGAGALVAGTAGGSAIWFYLRNRSLYGSLTGAAYNQQLFGFEPQDHVARLLASPAYLLRLYDGLWVWTRFNLPRVPVPPVLVAVPRVLALAWGVAVYAMVAFYDGHGGHTHPRYLFPGVAVLAVAGALGLDRLPGARRGLWIGGAALAQLLLTAAAWAMLVTALRGRRPAGPADLAGAVAGLLDAGGVPWPWPVLAAAGALLGAALTLLGLALAGLGNRPREPSPPDRVDGLVDDRREEVGAGHAPRDRAPTP